MAPSALYKDNYFEAVNLMKDGKYDECIDCAKYNLTDPTLSRYWRIKNLLLIGKVTDDWYEGEERRRQAEHVWYVANRMTREDEHEAKEALQELRAGLDTLKDALERQKPEDYDEDRLYEWALAAQHEEQVEDEEEMLEDTGAVHEAEFQLWGSQANIARRFREVGAAGAAARLAREEAAAAEQREKEAAAAKVKEEQVEFAMRKEEEAAAARQIKAEEEEQKEAAAAERQKAADEAAASQKEAEAAIAKQKEEAADVDKGAQESERGDRLTPLTIRTRNFMAPTVASKLRHRASEPALRKQAREGGNH